MAGRAGARQWTSDCCNLTSKALGFEESRDVLPDRTATPHYFPPLQFNPVSLATGEDYDYMLALKQEFRATIRELPYYIKPQRTSRDVQRYTDKYQLNGAGDSSSKWVPMWSRLPKELRIRDRKIRKDKTVLKPTILLQNNKSKANSSKNPKDVINTLKELEQQEAKASDEEDEKENEENKKLSKEKDDDNEDENEVDEEDYDEEEMEEGTDYISTYFDNGENYGDDEDDNIDDGPVY
ncbi:PREDICTED: DNA-directed RNA polymerase III subunit RPC7-like [Priapulus caudatus]|uniref:DNA-directed RNA polymerase III subunit RPC7-like n=1 Tax=Priapulus caudatus TaxID=37621 RepID=A0ABM1EYZ9_PRICU|nr:PREDICTED: DNA-directed RNA polymerase III subunit RPC7-like [Priapulus caudatus]